MGLVGDETRAEITMFFHVKLERNITLEPRHFGRRMNAVLEEKLRNEVRAERDRSDARDGAHARDNGPSMSEP